MPCGLGCMGYAPRRDGLALAKPRTRKSKRDFWHKQFFVLSVDMFNTDVGVAVNMSEAELERSVKRACSNAEYLAEVKEEAAGWDDDAACVYGRMLKMGGGFVVMLRLEKGNFRKAVAILTHEMVHVSQYLLRARRVPLQEETEEVHAYLVEHLVYAALRKLYT